jgi:hypothetical protein
MRSISRGGIGLLVLAAIGLAACDNTVVDNPTTPTPPTTVTDTFTGTIGVNAGASHAFAVSSGGTVTATLTAITPDDSVSSLSLGTWNGAACQIILVNDNTLQGNSIVGTVSSIGTLCVRIADTGKLVGPTDYTITVVHP